MGERWSMTIVHIKLFLRPIRHVGGEIDMKEGGFVSRLDPEAAGNLPARLRENFETTTEEPPMRLDPPHTLHRRK